MSSSWRTCCTSPELGSVALGALWLLAVSFGPESLLAPVVIAVAVLVAAARLSPPQYMG